MGAIAALIIVAFIFIQVVVFIVLPPPGFQPTTENVIGWFTLFHNNWLAAFIDMDLLLIIDYILMTLVFLGLWLALRHTTIAAATIALIFELISVTTYFASSTAFEMFSLSRQYAAAINDNDKISILGAGKAMLATWQGTAFNVSYILGAVALIIISIAILRYWVFSKAIGVSGLTAGILMAMPPSVGMIGLIFSFLSLIPTVAWLILVARELFHLSKLN